MPAALHIADEEIMTVPERSIFESAYAGQAPWDIGRPQKAFLDVADKIIGLILDAGCGTPCASPTGS